MIALIADVHISNHRRHGGPVKSGINRRCQYVLDALEVAVQRAKRRRATALVVLGDFFDTTRPEPQVVAAVQEILNGIPTYILMGNHDLVSTAPGDHSLGPLKPVAKIIDRPTLMSLGGVGLYCVPFQPGPAVDWLPQVLKETNFPLVEPTTLLLHLGLADEKTPVFLRGSHDVVPVSMVVDLCRQYGFTAAFAGNWHFHKVCRKKPLVCQVGTLAPTGWDNPGFEGHGAMALWDGKKMDMEWVPGPRFIKMHVDDDLEIPEGHNVFVQVLADSDHTGAALSVLKDALGEGLVVGGEVMPDIMEAKAAARKAAMVARSSDTLEEALASYVEEMPILKGVTREEVLAAVKKYLEA